MSRRCQPKQDENGNYLPNGQSRKAGLNKSFVDPGLSQFVDILSCKAEKAPPPAPREPRRKDGARIWLESD